MPVSHAVRTRLLRVWSETEGLEDNQAEACSELEDPGALQPSDSEPQSRGSAGDFPEGLRPSFLLRTKKSFCKQVGGRG